MVIFLLFGPYSPFQEVFLKGEDIQQEILPWVVDEVRQVLAQKLSVDEICSLEGPFVQKIFED